MAKMDPIPDDENGAVLKRMLAGGDELQKPRFVDFCFVFPEREQSLRFAGLVPEKDFEVCLSFYEERESWQVIVRKHMVPEHGTIGRIERELTQRAASVGGEADGWGCMRITE